MSIQCQSRITKTHKTAKDDCCWPMTVYGANDSAADLEVCGGEVTIGVKAVDEPDYHSDHFAVIEIEAVCSRCKHPYVPGLSHRSDRERLLTEALQFYLESKTVAAPSP